MGLEKPEGELKRKGEIPSEFKEASAAVIYEMDGDVAKMKVES